MDDGIMLVVVALGALALGAVLAWLLSGGRKGQGGADADLLARLYVLVEQETAAARTEAAHQRTHLSELERVMIGRIEQVRTELAERLAGMAGSMGREQAEVRAAQAEALREMAETSARQLSAIRVAVTDQLHEAVERQMQTSFQRVLEQFSAMQKGHGRSAGHDGADQRPQTAVREREDTWWLGRGAAQGHSG
ncbi:DNA recombination protein RmuC [Acetobacter malorum]|uniref:DNA recombination protein RmuC n=1 Tax=Acetobacter malorum TaxID=178901 RepID=A0A177GB33_9PROT|nr:DNA recombination protein RmuC [Acetobacter malorum]